VAVAYWHSEFKIDALLFLSPTCAKRFQCRKPKTDFGMVCASPYVFGNCYAFTQHEKMKTGCGEESMLCHVENSAKGALEG
jgi:hypothetical protein